MTQIQLICAQCSDPFLTYPAWARRGRKFCSRVCSARATIQTIDDIFLLPFVRNEDGCRLLIYLGGPFKGQVRSDYSEFMIQGEKRPTHQWVWEHTHGCSIPDGLLIRHLCPGGGNPACIEPTHLEIGTHFDNRQDAIFWDRTAKGDTNGARAHIERMPRGSEHGRSILTEDDVVNIRRAYIKRHPEFGIAGLAVVYSVGESTIRHIIQGHTWTHVASP